MSPSDPLVHKWLYESAPTGHVPWHAWQWSDGGLDGLLLMFGGMLLCLMMLFSERWGGEERLVFPLVRLPLQMIDPNYSDVPFFRCKATWIGIGLATFLNVINIIRGVFMGGRAAGSPWIWASSSSALRGAPCAR